MTQQLTKKFIANPDTCTHHFVFETPNGPTSRGVCKYCGSETTGRNYSTLEELRRRRLADSISFPQIRNHRKKMEIMY